MRHRTNRDNKLSLAQLFKLALFDMVRRNKYDAEHIIKGHTKRGEPLHVIKIQKHGHPLQFVQEFNFFTGRKYRADWGLPDIPVIIEIDGGVWIAGRHTRGSGFVNDCEKLNAAASVGYRIYRVATEKQIIEVLDFLKDDINRYFACERMRQTDELQWLRPVS